MSDITVSPGPSLEDRVPGDHWTTKNGTGFKNPWPSAQFPGVWTMAKFIYQFSTSSDPRTKEGKTLIPFTPPNYGASFVPGQLKATWLGHACAFVEFPTPQTCTATSAASVASEDLKQKGANRGVRALFDPVLNKGMAYAGMGPSRYSETPCKIEDIPEIDMIAISHNHYDHLDLPSLKAIYTAQRQKYNREPPIFLPLNNRHIVSGIGVGKKNIIEMDWWEERILEVEGRGKVKVVCTPSQHQSARGPFDKDNSLWSSWVVQDVSSDKKGASVWFAGDTGYCTMKEESHALADSTSVEACPAFKEIGKRYGPFTLGLIPIGAYYPRKVMSFCHAAPIESVRMFQDTKCQNAMAIHWGTFRMTAESITEPPEKLKVAKEELGVAENAFVTVAIGESKGYNV